MYTPLACVHACMYVSMRICVSARACLWGACALVNACMRQSSWRAEGSQTVSSCHHNTDCKSLHCPVMFSHDATAKGSREIENEPPVLEPCFGTVVNESLVTSPPFSCATRSCYPQESTGNDHRVPNPKTPSAHLS